MGKYKFHRLLAALGVAVTAAGLAGDAAAETVAYRYDARGRLVEVRRTGGPANGAVTAYSYDRANNRRQKVVTRPQ